MATHSYNDSFYQRQIKVSYYLPKLGTMEKNGRPKGMFIKFKIKVTHIGQNYKGNNLHAG